MVWTVQPPALHDYASNTMLLFTSFLLLSCVGAAVAIGGAMPPDPSVHWPGHSWIHFMKRLHVIMSIGCFLMNLCACFFSVFALHRTLAGGFDTRATSATEVIVRELEFEYVAVSAYFFAGTMLLMGPVGIRCFCMVQQGLRSDTLAASVMCLIVGVVLLILSFFNQHLVQFPFVSYGQVVHRFMELSFEHCFAGDKPALIMLLAWTLQVRERRERETAPPFAARAARLRSVHALLVRAGKPTLPAIPPCAIFSACRRYSPSARSSRPCHGFTIATSIRMSRCAQLLSLAHGTSG